MTCDKTLDFVVLNFNVARHDTHFFRFYITSKNSIY